MTNYQPQLIDDERNPKMRIIETHVYQSATLPGAPERATRTEAEADEARGIELAAYLALLPKLTAEQWIAEREAAWGAAGVAAREAALDAEREAAWGAAWAKTRSSTRDATWGANALIVRDLISAKHFNILTAPMRAAGIDFDNLAPHE